QFTSSITTNGLGSFKFKVTDNTGFSYTNQANVRVVPAPPLLGIRKESGEVLLELTDALGRAVTVQSKTNLNGTWDDWTNFTANGPLQLLPLNGLTNQSQRFFRAFSQ